MSGDDETPKTILTYVPKKTYLCTDARYTDLAEFLTGWITAIGADFWKAKAMHIYNLFQLSRTSSLTDEELDLERADQMLNATLAWNGYANVVSYGCSLVCKETGLDEAAVRKHIGLPEAEEIDIESLSTEHRETLDHIMSIFHDAMKRLPQ